MQLGDDNESVIAVLQKTISLEVVKPQSILERLYIEDTTAE